MSLFVLQWLFGAVVLSTIWVGLIAKRARSGEYIRADLMPELAIGLIGAICWPAVIVGSFAAFPLAFLIGHIIAANTPEDRLL